MKALTVQERILEELRLSSRALDDDELASRLGITPRQTINQACRKLATAGRLRRYPGPDRKIVNGLVRDGETPSRSDPAVRTQRLPSAPGDSAEQRQAEEIMLKLLGEHLGVSLQARRVFLPNGARVEIDGADDDLTVLAEAWAHQGRPKAAQKHKVLSDALKMLYVASTLPTAPRLVICLADPDAAYHFTSASSWAALALKDFGIEVHVVALPAELQASVWQAQKRQYR